MFRTNFVAFILLILCVKLNAQKTFLETQYVINDLYFSSTNGEIVYANDTRLYFVDYETLEPKDSVTLITDNSKYISSFEYLNTPQPLIVIKTKTKQKYYQNFFEYPEDSIYFLNRAQKKVINKFSGNIYASFNEENPSIAVVGYNEFFDFKDDYGNVNKSPLTGKLESLPNRIAVASSGTIRKIKVNNSGNKVAIIYQKYFGKDDPHDHILELRDLPSLDSITSKKIKYKTHDIYFSDDDNYLILKQDEAQVSSSSLSRKEFFKIYDTSTLSDVEILPESLNVNGVIENNTVWRHYDAEIIQENFNTKKTLQRIWSNLTPFSVIDGFEKVDGNTVLIYGNKGYGYGTVKNGIYKFQLKDEAVYSEVKKVSTIDTLFNPSEVRIMDNKTKVYAVDYSQKGNKLLVKEEVYKPTNFELWSTLDKKKLYDIELPQTVNPMLDNNGETVLFFEQHQGKAFDEFKLKVLDISTGIVKVALYEDSDFNALSAKCHNLKTKPNEWVCSDGFAKFWRINTDDLSVNLIKDLSNESYYRTDVTAFEGIPDSDNVLLALRSVNVAPNHSITESNFEGFKIFSPDNGLTSDLPSIQEYQYAIPVNDSSIILKDESRLQLYNVVSNTFTDISTTQENSLIKDVLVLGDKADIIIDKANSYGDSLQITSYNFKDNKIEESYKIDGYKNGLFKTFEGINYYGLDSFYTYNKTLDAEVGWSSHKPKYTQEHDLNISSNGKLLYGGQWLIDLKKLELEQQLPSFTANTLLEDDEIVSLDTDSDKYGSKDYNFRIVSAQKTDSVLWKSKTVRIDFNERPSSRVWSKDKNYVLYYNSSQLTENQTVYLIDVKNRLLVSKKVDFKIKKARFADDALQVVLTSHSDIMQLDIKTVFYDINGLKKIKEITTDFDDEVDENSYVFTDYEFLLHYNRSGETVEKIKSYYARRSLSTSVFIKEKDLLVAGTYNGALVFWDKNNSSPKHIEQISDSEIIRMQQIKDLLYILSKDSEISVVNLNTLKLEVSCKIFEKEDEISLAWITPEGYFKANKSDIRKFHFVKDGRALPLIDYEMFLNRPDIIMKRLGFASPKFYDLYKNAYLKRLVRNGYQENTDIFNLERPKLKLLNRQEISILTDQRQIDLNIENTSKSSELIVYINGVPTNKRLLKNESILKETIELNSGINRVSIISKDDSGTESEPISFEVTSTIKRSQSKLYYIGIGVSNYQDSTMNLKYADKDVARISEVLNSKYENNIVVKTLLNDQVNKKSVQELKTLLRSTDIDDTVIVSFSGHGLIGKDNEFFFATHNINFDTPEEHGLSYSEIQDLLTDIPARRKLLLLDACHSGELDASNNSSGLNTKVVSRIPEGAKGSKAKSKTAKNEESFNLMQTLFFDIDRGNGAYVISAAGGSEFAYEDEKWENGVFTYSFLSALNDLGYDTWRGEQGIPISELKDYVYNKVKELTNNKQRPTSRAENLEWDWFLN